MEVLVDYNNLMREDLNRGPTYIIDKLLAALGPPHLTGQTRIAVRLYDGWYEEQVPTRRAQEVSPKLLADFPKMHVFSAGANTSKLIVTAEMAYSMMIDPATHMWHTLRTKAVPRNLSCADPATVGCSISPCDLAATHKLFREKKCPKAGCTVTLPNLVKRVEQKLVDGMLAADLYYLHRQGKPKVVLVSSDDDMWPAVRTVLELGMGVVQVHPLTGHRTSYNRGPLPQYTEIDL